MVNIKCKSGSADIERLSCSGTLGIDCDSGKINMYIDEFSGGSLSIPQAQWILILRQTQTRSFRRGTRCYINGLCGNERRQSRRG